MTGTATEAWRPRLSGALVIPVVALAGAYLWLAIDVGSPWLWSRVVHEDGARTFGQTVLYWRHFLREIPVALLYAASLLIAGLPVLRARFAAGAGGGSRSVGWAAFAAAAMLCLAGYMLVAARGGPALALGDLFQHYIRDDVGWRVAHWAAHYASCIVFWCSCAIVFAPLRMGKEIGTTAFAFSALLAVLALPLAYDPAASISSRLMAHQAREIMTHLVITLPLAAYVLVGTPQWPADWRIALRRAPVGIAAGVAAITTIVLVAGTFAGGALQQVPAAWSARVATHVFEHALDIVLVLLLVLAGRELLGPQRADVRALRGHDRAVGRDAR